MCRLINFSKTPACCEVPVCFHVLSTSEIRTGQMGGARRRCLDVGFNNLKIICYSRTTVTVQQRNCAASSSSHARFSQTDGFLLRSSSENRADWNDASAGRNTPESVRVCGAF